MTLSRKALAVVSLSNFSGRVGKGSVSLLFAICAAVCLLPSLAFGQNFYRTQPPVPRPEIRANFLENYGKLPLHFEPNMGQVEPRVRFVSRGGDYTLFLTSSEAVLVLRPPTATGSRTLLLEGAPNLGNTETAAPPVLLRSRLVGANSDVRLSASDELEGKSNYFIGNDPKAWRTNVPNYRRVRYRNVYRGIDLVYYGNQGRLEYDFVVRPGADPRKIGLGISGSIGTPGRSEKGESSPALRVDPNGDLVVIAGDTAIRYQRPVAYQIATKRLPQSRTEAQKRIIDVRYVLRAENRVEFEVGAYDKKQPLVIDPVLVYSTYLGGSFPDQALSVAVDSAGAAYVAGITCSADFPVTTGAFQTAHKGPGGNCANSQNSFEDAFVTKFNPAGTALVYSTYIGGSASDRAYAIAVDSSGNAYFAGQTQSADYPTTTGAFLTTCPGGVGGCNTGVVTKLNSTGSLLVYSTYMGGPGNMGATGIAVNSLGQAYITGATDESYPTTASAFQASNPKFSLTPVFTVLNASGSGLIYSTFLGGTQGGSFNPGSQAFGVAIDASGLAYITGWTDSPDFPTTAGAFQTKCGTDGNCNGLWDAFVAKFDPTKSGAASLVYSTFLGGSGTDIGFGIAVDSAGNAYVTGTTGANVNSQFTGGALPSSDFPTTVGAFQTTCPGTCTHDSAWITKLNASGSALVYSTYLGGSGNTDSGDFRPIALDSSLNVYVTGFTAATDFPVKNPTQAINGGGTFDAYVTELNASGSALVFSTFLGGSNSDQAIGMALDKNSNIYVTGITSSTDFPHTAGAFQTACPGSCTFFHAFVTKIGRFDTSTSLSSSLNPSIFGQSVTFTASVNSSAAGTLTGTVTFNDGATTLTSVALSGGIAKFATTALAAGTHSITAVYSGDGTFVPSTSSVLSQVVAPAGSPSVSLSPGSLSFAQQLVLSTSPSKPVTLTNTGAGTLTISSITAYGNFNVLSTTCPLSPATLAAAAHCTINVTFTPSQAGRVLGELTVIDNAPNQVQDLNLSGNGVTPLNTSPTGVSFGSVTVGTTSAAKTVTLINNSTSSLTISFAPSADYAALGSGTTPCGASLTGKSKCTMSVTFAPKSNGTIAGAVTVSYNAASSPIEVVLSGSGAGGPASPLKFTPASLSFASQLVGTSSPVKVVTLTNVGASSVTINSFASSGDFSSAASGTTPCSNGLVLAATKTCTFSVTFNPTVNGIITGAVSVNDSSAVTPQVLNVSGKGAEAVSLSPNTLNFGTTSIGTTSAGKTVTVTNNNQSSAVTLNPIAASGNFKISATTCTSSLAAKSKCTFTVTFTPTLGATVGGVASVSYSSLGSPQVANLTGTGQ